MIRKVGGPGGEFPVGENKQPSLDRLSQDSSKVGKFVTSHAQGETNYTLTGRVTANFKDPDYLQAMRQHYAED